MEKKRIEQLKERRLLLQAELRLKALRDRITSKLNYLDAQGYDYTIYYDNEHLDWIYENVPFRKRDGYLGQHDYQIDVDDASETCRSIYCNSEQSLINTLREYFLAIKAEDSRLIVCTNGGDPEIEISVEALLSQPLLFFSGTEIWIVLKDRSWIIEYIGEQEVIRFVQLQFNAPVLVKRILLIPD